MIQFPCSACGKKMNAKDELADKRVTCPGCGQIVRVPKPAPSKSPVPAGPVGDTSTLPPVSAPAPPIKYTLSGSEAETGSGGGLGPAAEYTDFLAPPQVADEIGRLG